MKILKSKDIKKLRELYLFNQNETDPLTKDIIIKPCLDHDHVNGYCRATLDYNSNQFLGKVESAWKRFGYKYSRSMLPYVLHNVAEYLEKSYEDHPVHPKHITTLVGRFKRWNIQKQNELLKSYRIKPANNKNGNVKQYRSYLMKDKNMYKFK